MRRSISSETRNHLEIISGIMIRCFFITVIALMFVWFVSWITGDLFYKIYTIFFSITRNEYDLFFLYSFAFMKVLNVMLFFFPYIAIKFLLRGFTSHS